MSNRTLNEQIVALTAELTKLKSTTDKETRLHLAALQEQLTRIAEHHGDESVADRLEAIAVRFEADHPAVGTALRQAIDALSKAGI